MLNCTEGRGESSVAIGLGCGAVAGTCGSCGSCGSRDPVNDLRRGRTGGGTALDEVVVDCMEALAAATRNLL